MVPKGMASLKNLLKLCMIVKEFNMEGLYLLMGMSALAHLELGVRMTIKENLTIGSNGFKLLKVFHFKYLIPLTDRGSSTDELQLTFAPGAVPALRQLHLQLNPMEVTSDFFADFGIEHFSGLAHFKVEIDCFRAALSRVEALESSIEKATNLHLNPKMEIHVSRTLEDNMYMYDKQWEAELARRREHEEYYSERHSESIVEDETSE